MMTSFNFLDLIGQEEKTAIKMLNGVGIQNILVMERRGETLMNEDGKLVEGRVRLYLDVVGCVYRFIKG